MKECAYCGRENPDEVTSCQECGTSEFKSLNLTTRESQLIAQILAASDDHNKLWSPQEVAEAKYALIQRFQAIPTLDRVYRLIGKSKTDETIERIIEDRLQYIEEVTPILSVDVPKHLCHKCSRQGEVLAFPFGLAKLLSTERDWSTTLASVAISIVTMPLTGYGLLSGPSKRQQARVIRLELQLCSACLELKKGILGRVKLRQDDYALHPRWKSAKKAGYEKFLTPQELKEHK